MDEEHDAKTPHDRGIDPSPNKIWSVYMSEADRQDLDLTQTWKGDMDAILIFAGLFSATITAFIIESYKTLSPNPAETSLAVLRQISLQLAAITNTTQTGVILPLPGPAPFEPAVSSMLCNAFWFLSLGFSLSCALAATLVDQWTRNYLQASQRRPAPHKRARIRAYLYMGLQRFGMKTVVETIPTLLHISLLLFFAGLIEFLLPINSIICHLTIAVLAICAGLYIMTTLLPILYRDCPYHTPLSAFCWWTFQVLRLYSFRSGQKFQVTQPITMSQAREMAAMERTPARRRRDEEAIRWTLASLTEDNELEPFVEGIVGYLSDGDDAKVALMQRLLADVNVKLGPRIVSLLRQAGYQHSYERQRCAVACLSAMWSLIINRREPTSPGTGMLEWFDDETLPVLETYKYDSPGIAHYLCSTSTLFLMKLLDDFSSSSTSAEQQLTTPGIERLWINAEPWVEQQQVQTNLSNPRFLSSSSCIMAMKAWLQRIKRTLPSTRAGRGRANMHTIEELIQSLWAFQAAVNETRLAVLLDFVTEMLSDSPPYEALETFYDIVIDSDCSIFPVSLYTQNLLIQCLEHGIINPRFPRLAIDHLLTFVTVLDDPGLVKKARRTITRYATMVPDSLPASRALNILQEEEPHPSTASILDIFSSHIYATVEE